MRHEEGGAGEKGMGRSTVTWGAPEGQRTELCSQPSLLPLYMGPRAQTQVTGLAASHQPNLNFLKRQFL